MECEYNNDFKWSYAIILKDQVRNLNAFTEKGFIFVKEKTHGMKISVFTSMGIS